MRWRTKLCGFCDHSFANGLCLGAIVFLCACGQNHGQATPNVSTSTAAASFELTMELCGICAFKGFLNGAKFKMQGVAANGSPYFKAIGDEQYMYYDEDCDGSGKKAARWVIDPDPPNKDRMRDLDQDFDCMYHARVDSEDRQQPPTAGDWIVFCGGEGWKVQKLALVQHPLGAGVPEIAPAAPDTLVNFSFSGTFCAGREILQDLEFDKAGRTRSGSNFFKSRRHDLYMYHDPSCEGPLIGTPRWIIDDDAPNPQRERDLDEDSQCLYLARVDSASSMSPPLVAFWKVQCEGGWQDICIAMNVTGEENVGEASAARRPRRRLAALILSILVLILADESLP